MKSLQGIIKLPCFWVLFKERSQTVLCPIGQVCLPPPSLCTSPLVWANYCPAQYCSQLLLDFVEKGVHVTPDPNLEQPVTVSEVRAGAHAAIPSWPCALSIGQGCVLTGSRKVHEEALVA